MSMRIGCGGCGGSSPTGDWVERAGDSMYGPLVMETVDGAADGATLAGAGGFLLVVSDSTNTDPGGILISDENNTPYVLTLRYQQVGAGDVLGEFAGTALDSDNTQTVGGSLQIVALETWDPGSTGSAWKFSTVPFEGSALTTTLWVTASGTQLEIGGYIEKANVSAGGDDIVFDANDTTEILDWADGTYRRVDVNSGVTGSIVQMPSLDAVNRLGSTPITGSMVIEVAVQDDAPLAFDLVKWQNDVAPTWTSGETDLVTMVWSPYYQQWLATVVQSFNPKGA